MTRLTPDLIEGVPNDEIDLDSRLLKMCGKTVKQLALEGAGCDHDVDFSKFRVACVPITSGVPSRNLSTEHSLSILSIQASAF